MSFLKGSYGAGFVGLFYPSRIGDVCGEVVNRTATKRSLHADVRDTRFSKSLFSEISKIFGLSVFFHKNVRI